MLDNLTTINVSEISEFPTQLGTRCHLMNEHKISPYASTEEELLDFLEETNTPQNFIDFCVCDKSKCKAFYNEFLKGETPFLGKEPIILDKYNNMYQVVEGKHRVCLAMRAKIPTLQAVVQASNEMNKRLEEVGGSGVFNFVYYKTFNKIFGSAPIVYIDFTKTKAKNRLYEFNRKFILLDEEHATNGQYLTIVDGVKYKLVTKTIFAYTKIVCNVIIDDNHTNTKIWLQGTKKSGKNPKNAFAVGHQTDLYRRGSFRFASIDKNVRY